MVPLYEPVPSVAPLVPIAELRSTKRPVQCLEHGGAGITPFDRFGTLQFEQPIEARLEAHPVRPGIDRDADGRVPGGPQPLRDRPVASQMRGDTIPAIPPITPRNVTLPVEPTGEGDRHRRRRSWPGGDRRFERQPVSGHAIQRRGEIVLAPQKPTVVGPEAVDRHEDDVPPAILVLDRVEPGPVTRRHRYPRSSRWFATESPRVSPVWAVGSYDSVSVALVCTQGTRFTAGWRNPFGCPYTPHSPSAFP